MREEKIICPQLIMLVWGAEVVTPTELSFRQHVWYPSTTTGRINVISLAITLATPKQLRKQELNGILLL